MWQYWRFYWPLALTGLAMVLAIQFQNAILARFPDAVTELAIFALAYSTFGFFRASLNFVAQLSNVYARSPQGTRLCHRFITIASVLIMLPLIGIGHSAFGTAIAEPSAFSPKPSWIIPHAVSEIRILSVHPQPKRGKDLKIAI